MSQADESKLEGKEKEVKQEEAKNAARRKKAVQDFIGVEEPSYRVDPYELINPNPKYKYRFSSKAKVTTALSSLDKTGNAGPQRAGSTIWMVVDKTHPEFRDLRIQQDHTPDKSYFSYGGLVLCCTRTETYANQRKMKADKAAAAAGRTSELDAGNKAVARATGGKTRDGVFTTQNDVKRT